VRGRHVRAGGGNPAADLHRRDRARARHDRERYRRGFHAYIAPALEAAKDPSYPEAGRRNMKAALHLADHLHEAPVHLFVAGWTRRGEAQGQALFPCIQNVLLACRAVGLGASLTTLHRSFGAECDRWLGLPESCPTIALLPMMAAGNTAGRARAVDRPALGALHRPPTDPLAPSPSPRLRSGYAEWARELLPFSDMTSRR
jgi:hypothetical protein